MSCEKWQQQFPEFLSGALEAGTAARVSAHLAECSACRDEARRMGELWEKLGDVSDEEPSLRVRGRFYEMLETYAEGSRQAHRPSVVELRPRAAESAPAPWWRSRGLVMGAIAAGALLVGIFAGQHLPGARVEQDQIAALRSEVYRMRQTVALSLLENQSPTDRLRGVDYSARINSPDDQVLQALLDTLDRDGNVNVRLAAADALQRYINQPLVRRRLRDSLRRQESPLLQVALLDMLAEGRDSQARPEILQLANEPDANPAVRQRARLALEQIP